MRSFFRRLRWLTQRSRKEAELREELEFHLEEEAEQHQAEGLAEEQARWAARRELGNLTLLQEDTRATWTWTFVEQLAQDTRYGLRMIAANKNLQRDGDPVACLGNRSQHGDLQLHGFDPAALATGARFSVAGDAELAYPAPQHARHQPA